MSDHLSKDERVFSLRMALAVGCMDPRFRAACEGVLTLVDEVSAERDSYRQQAEINAQTVKDQADVIHELQEYIGQLHLENL